MNNEIMWVGIRFDPTERYDVDSYLDRQHQIILDLCGSSGEVHTRFGIAIAYHTAKHEIVGFGIPVKTVADGQDKLKEVERWFRSIGISLFVSVWSWSPAERMPYSAGLKGLKEQWDYA